MAHKKMAEELTKTDSGPIGVVFVIDVHIQLCQQRTSKKYDLLECDLF